MSIIDTIPDNLETALWRLITQLRWEIVEYRGQASAARHDCDVWRRRAKESEAALKALRDASTPAEGAHDGDV